MTDSSMPSSYDSNPPPATGGGSVGPRMDYVKSIPGILKIVEMVLSLITFICASVYPWFTWNGGGWVQFVAMSALLTVAINFVLYFLSLRERLPPVVQNPIIVLSFLTFICACVWSWGGSQSWVEFVSITALMSTIGYFVLHLFSLISRFPGPWLMIEFIFYCVFTAFYLISAIVCAVKGWYHSSVAASAFFAFAATAVFAVDTFFQFKSWRSGMDAATSSTGNTKSSAATVEQQHY